MRQTSFTDMEYANRRRKTRREEFLDMMQEILPWDEIVALVEPHYFKGGRGRPPIGAETMVRMYLLQSWFSLSDEGVEDAIYDSYAFRSFMKIDFTDAQAPDATTLCKFRHMMEEHGLGKAIFDAISDFLEENGRIMHGGTIVDATIINAPSSTKNAKGQRDPEMHQTKKGNQWYFGMKTHIGVDAATGYVHSLTGTAANVADINEMANLIREDDEKAWGDGGYLGVEKRDEVVGDEHLSTIEWHINRRPTSIDKQYPAGISRDYEKEIETKKSSVRSKVEHPFHVVKNIFGYKKVRYRGIKKNLDRIYVLFASANLYMLGCAMRIEQKLRRQGPPLASACR